MNYLSITRLLIGLFIVILLSACVTSPPQRMDSRFGLAVEMAKAQQTINPDASLNTAPVIGVDGQAGDAMFDNYRRSFIRQQTQTQTRSPLDIGTSGGSQ